ncbi:MAG: amino acid ABC transporter permease [Candidatus Adiutrix sp.]|jgi:polar amino acid transport system permease protein|nr:amino acid ABC transporter permease [Candidatus Adiutrix sp.]
MIQPYKKRKIDQALARQEAPPPEKPVTIDIADGPAIPRPSDPGLYSAWKFVMIATPLIMIYLTTYDQIGGFIVRHLPEFFWRGNFLEDWALTERNAYRAFFFFMPDGFQVTFQVTLFSIPVAVFLGVITGLCRISRRRPINLAASIYVEVVRGIPLLVQLFYLYYALGRLITIPPLGSAVLAISFCYGAYMGEVVRSGIEAIDRGQREAALSLGFTPFQAMFYVILPQAVRTILPPVGNECIALLKDSTLVSVLAIADIMRRAREFATISYDYFEAYTMVALVYLFLTLLLSKLVSKMEGRMGSYERR